MTAPASTPIIHVALTVSDLEASIAWYAELFGTPPAFTGSLLEGTPHHYTLAVWTVPNLGLHHFEQQVEGAFSERRPGLDHVAFGCADVDQLEAWAAHLDAIGVAHGAILTEPYGSGLSFRDPDGIALEFFVRAVR
jgi:glyoxylase I family protein